MKEALVFLTNILKDKDIVVLGLSGGPDSMCLLDILRHLNKDITIIAVHINHNIRKESIKELEFINDYCKKNNITLETTTFDKKGKDIDYSEAELREKRYNYFETIINKYKANYLLTAHHGDELIETNIMRSTRGSDIKGYSGFQTITNKKDYKVLKPLVYSTKEEILEYLKDNNIPFVEDKSNNSDKYTRNRYRHNILPALKEENKSIHLKYLKFSNELIKYQEYMDRVVDKELSKRFNNNILDITNYESIDLLVLENILKKVLDYNYIDNLYLVSDKHINYILELIKNNKPNISINLPDNLTIKKEYNKLIITRNNNSNEDYNILLEDNTLLPNNKTISYIEDIDNNSNCITRLNSKELSLPLFVRNRKEGDKMIIKNMNNAKKIKDIFIDSKLSKSKRDNQPIVVDSKGTILWLPGLKKSKFDKAKNENYDIILWYN